MISEYSVILYFAPLIIHQPLFSDRKFAKSREETLCRHHVRESVESRLHVLQDEGRVHRHRPHRRRKVHARPILADRLQLPVREKQNSLLPFPPSLAYSLLTRPSPLPLPLLLRRSYEPWRTTNTWRASTATSPSAPSRCRCTCLTAASSSNSRSSGRARGACRTGPSTRIASSRACSATRGSGRARLPDVRVALQ